MSSNSKTIVPVNAVGNASTSEWVILLKRLRDDELPEPVETGQVVGYDRGFEPDHIIGATERDGQLVFLMAWKNSDDGKADLLEASEVYQRSPQVAIKFLQERFCHFPPLK